ncbi:MAG: PDZ domain-containing protein, partial [Candidatus Zixiibacteriota bacterium]
VVRGWLGVSIQDVNDQIADAMGLEETKGALVGDVVPDSPAEKAGFRPGDIIVTMDSRSIKNTAQLRSAVASTAPGTKVEFQVLRDNRRLTLTVELGELPSEIAQFPTGGDIEELLGFSVSMFTDDLADRYGIDNRLKGVVVISIDPNSKAYQAGVREGDLIRSVNKKRVQTPKEFAKLVSKMKKGDTILLRVHRQGGGFFIAFVL